MNNLIGKIAICCAGKTGLITSKKVKNGQIIWTGTNLNNGNFWQSKYPKLFNNK